MLLVSILSVLVIALFLATVFLGKELLKKFVFTRDFARSSNQLVMWKYLADRKPGMYNIVLRGKTPFCVLVGFHLHIRIFGYSGFDHYGFVRSNEKGIAIISTYLGKSSCEFQFLVNTDIETNPIVATSDEKDQKFEPDFKSAPHWYQRLGIF